MYDMHEPAHVLTERDIVPAVGDSSRIARSLLTSGQQANRTPEFCRMVSLAWLLPGTVLVGSILWIIWTRTAMVPYWDEWETVILVQHANAGTLSLAEIWALHAGVHRIAVPRIVDLLLIWLTHWNRQVEMTFDLAVALASAWLLYVLVRRTARSARLTLALVAPVSLLFFSLAQFADWFAPFQLCFTATVFGLLLALWAVTSDAQVLSWRRFAAALLGALIAMLSSFAGLMVWPAVLPTLAWNFRRAPRPPTAIRLLLWIWVTCAAWLMYLSDFSPATTSLPLSDKVKFALVYLGAPIGFPDVTRSGLFGLLGLALWLVTVALYFVLGGRLTRLLPWVDVALFVGLVTAATVNGRSDGGTALALSSRYEIFSAFWWIELVVLCALVLRQFWRGRSAVWPERTAHIAKGHASRLSAWVCRLLRAWNVRSARRRLIQRRSTLFGVYTVALVLMFASLIVANIAGLQDALIWQGAQQSNQYRLLNYQSQPDSCLVLYYPWPSLERDRVPVLEQDHYGLFALPVAEQQRLLRAAEVASDMSGCVKPYFFIDDARRPPPVHRPW
jgi:hypothetical protein